MFAVVLAVVALVLRAVRWLLTLAAIVACATVPALRRYQRYQAGSIARVELLAASRRSVPSALTTYTSLLRADRPMKTSHPPSGTQSGAVLELKSPLCILNGRTLRSGQRTCHRKVLVATVSTVKDKACAIRRPRRVTVLEPAREYLKVVSVGTDDR